VVFFAKSNFKLQEIVKKLTNLMTDAALQINTKKTTIMTNSDEAEIILKGEDVEHVPKNTYLGQLITFRDKAGRKSEEIGVFLNKFNSLGVYIGPYIPKT
jgi:uncharacterized protein YdeI (BOF family)